MSSLTVMPIEQYMIGAICSSRGSVLDEYPITVDHFTDPDHIKLFNMLSFMHKEGKQISEQKIREMIYLDNVEFQIDMTEALHYPYLTQVPDLWEVLNDRFIKRGAYKVGTWITESAKDKFLEGNDVIDEAVQKLLGLKVGDRDESVTDAEFDAEEERYRSVIRGETQKSIRTPFVSWNESFGGILEGGMYVLSGRPGAGKNAMVEQMIEKMISEERPVLMFAKDMSPGVMVKRLICRRAGVPYWRYVRDVIHKHEQAPLEEAFNYYKGVRKFLRVMNPPNLTAERLASIVRSEARVNKIQCVFLDHFGTIKLGKRDVVEGLTVASIALRTMVNETKIPLVVLAHINRTGAKGKPSAEDIKFCDQLYGDCDGMAMLWTDQDRTELPYGEKLKMYMSITKNRSGAITDDPILFDGVNLTFHNEN